METVVSNILDALRQGPLDAKGLDRIIRAESKRQGDGRRRIAKKRILPYFLQERQRKTATWASWNTTPELEERFIKTLQMKPRRTASGVATITVITKPWPCGGTCVFCPNDIRMPKSYLHNEPACQRAERNFFDPWLQVASRLGALEAMGHATDKIELIVLGGSWTDYPRPYGIWFIQQLFACLNATKAERQHISDQRQKKYEALGIECDPALLAQRWHHWQKAIDQGELSYNQALAAAFDEDDPWIQTADFQRADWESLETQQRRNETARHRVVGLVTETRPDGLDVPTLISLRRLGCTKVQIGIQSLDESLLAKNGRSLAPASIERAFELCRLFGFKTHAHFMVNLVGATPASDRAGYRQLVSDGRFMPDEVKLYPCALVEGTGLMELWRQGQWAPYDEDQLVAVLRDALCATPPCTRISRMIRDISSEDIVAGNKKTNLRQLVEQGMEGKDQPLQEIRFRELGCDAVAVSELSLDVFSFDTPATIEHFLQWVTPQGKIAGFLRLSLPRAEALGRWGDALPIEPGQAMIREVHIYGFAERLDHEGNSAQHHGLGRALVARACRMARQAGYQRLNVISAVGTREYYRKLGFADAGLYQQIDLESERAASLAP